MEEKKVKKEPGCCLIEVDVAVFEFIAADRSHDHIKDIDFVSSRIDKHLKCLGHDEHDLLTFTLSSYIEDIEFVSSRIDKRCCICMIILPRNSSLRRTGCLPQVIIEGWVISGQFFGVWPRFRL